MSPTDAIRNGSGALVAGLTNDGVAIVQLDASGHPLGGPLLVALGAANPTISEAAVLAYTRAENDRDIFRVFVQRPRPVVRSRAAAH
jgi:hypothetical protein